VRVFLRECVDSVAKRCTSLIVLNWLFFGVVVVGVFLGQFGFEGLSVLPVGEVVFVEGVEQGVLLFFGVFFWNLVVSGFVLLSLSGALFFVLPGVFLLVRGLLWGILLSTLPTASFLAVLPTLVLEGEGYVLAGLVGVHLGLSWLRPSTGSDGMPPFWLDSLKRELKESVRIYVLVVLLLLVAAVVEVLTYFMLF